MIRKDFRSAPVRRMVVMGESNAYGMSACSAKNEWVQVLGEKIRAFQEGPMRIINNAIPANVISPDAPGYDPEDVYGTAPSALERFEEDMIAYRPDLAVFAYGLNDSRCGHALESFLAAYRTIVTRTREALPRCLMVLVGPYWNLQYDAETWAQPACAERVESFGKFNRGGDALVLSYNKALASLAEEVGAVYVDVYSVLEGAPWLLTADACHFNDVGQHIIGLAVFTALAGQCSFLAASSKRMETELGMTLRNTGGTNGLRHVIESWRTKEDWKQ